jgi:tRNA dimethylallyltransferase
VADPLVIVGATATGKTDLAMALARASPGAEIVAVDSMQVYKGMDIGTAKPTASQRAEIAHHCLDLVDPSDEFSLSQFQEAVRAALTAIESRGGTPVLVGGTGLYIRAVVDDLEIPGRYPEARALLDAEPDTAQLHSRLGALDPVSAARMEPTNRRRIIRALEVCLGGGRPFSTYGPGLDAYPPTRFRQIGLQMSRERIDERIAARYDAQIRAGFLDEVRGLLAAPAGISPTARQALGYRELLSHLEEGVPLEAALEEAIRRTRRFARRQERWFRRDPRIVWVEAEINPMAALQDALGESAPCS